MQFSGSFAWSFSVDLTEYIMDSITKNSPKFKLDCPSFCCLSVSLIPSDNIFLQRNFIKKIFEVRHFVKTSRYGTKSNLRYCFVSMKFRKTSPSFKQIVEWHTDFWNEFPPLMVVLVIFGRYYELKVVFNCYHYGAPLQGGGGQR